MQQLHDTDIINMVLKGQQQSFSILVSRYQHFVFTIALRYVNNREEAEEIAQDVFVKAYRSLAGFNGKSKFSTWLYAITHHTSLSYMRKTRITTLSVDAQPALEAAMPATEDTALQIERNSTRSMLQNTMNRMGGADAEVLTLFYTAGQSLEEIAIITGQSPNNIKVRLFRARQKLKKIIEQYYPTDAVALK